MLGRMPGAHPSFDPPPDTGSGDGRDARVTAIVLAGGDESDLLARTVGAPAKALVPLKGRPLGAYVLDALRDARSVRRVVWVGACDAAMARSIDVAVPGGPRFVDSLTLGVGAALAGGRPGERLLLSSADVPWLRGAAVDRFVEAAGRDHELVYPVVSRAACEATFPQLRRTWIRLADGEVTGGNLLSGTPEAVIRLLPWVDAVTRARKAPLRLAAMVGPAVLVGLLSGRVTLRSLERRLGRRLGSSLRVMMSDDPTLGTDVDRPEHLPATLELSAPLGEELLDV